MVNPNTSEGTTMVNMNEVVVGVTLTKALSVSPDNEAKKEGIRKRLIVKMSYDGLTFADVFAKALKNDIVSMQNGNGPGGRRNFDKLVDRQVIEVSAKAPGAGPQADPETAMIMKLQAMKPEEQVAYLKELAAKAIKG